MEGTLILIDEGFLSKVSKHFGNGKYLKFDKIEFSKRISKQQELFCKHIFYYTAPPFQGNPLTEKEKKMKEGYDRFIMSLNKNKIITIREGRVQKTFNKKGQIKFKQKGVDTLMTIDLSHVTEDYPNIKKIILISSDTDFCPVIRDIKKRYNIEIILGTYFERKRSSKFSLSNELIKCCSRYFKLTKEDFTSCSIK